LYVQHLQMDHRLQARYAESDLVQDALLKALQHLPQFRGQSEAEFVRWLREIQNNVYRDRVEQELAQKRDVRRERALNVPIRNSSACFDRFIDRRLPPEQEAARREQFARVTAAIDELPEPQRMAIILREFNNCSVVEIAEQLHCTEKAVANLIYRA